MDDLKEERSGLVYATSYLLNIIYTSHSNSNKRQNLMKEEKKMRDRIGSDPHKPYLKKKGSKYKRIEMGEEHGIGGTY